MKISTRVRLAIALIFVILSANLLMFLVLSERQRKMTGELRHAEAIIQHIAALRSETYEFLHYRTERVRKQWQTTYETLRLMLADPDTKPFLENYRPEIDAKLSRMAETFSILVQYGGDQLHEQDTALQDAQRRLAAQMLPDTYDIISLLYQPIDNLRGQVASFGQWVFYLNIGSLLILSTALAAAAFFLHKSIVAPVLALSAGVVAIGRGDLDYRVGFDSRDEIGQLSRTIDQMTDSLKEWRDKLVRESEEHKRTWEALRESEERLRLAQSKAGVGIWDWNIPSQTLTWTPELELLYGLQTGTIHAYKDWSRLVHPDDLACIEAERDEAVAQNLPFDCEFRILHASGQTRWLQSIGGAIYDDDGRPTRVFGVNIDITERKRIEETLQDSEARFRLAQKAAKIGTFEWNIRTGVNTWTPELEEMYGLPLGSFAGTQRAWEELVHPEDRPEALRKVEEAFRTGEPVEGEWRVVWSDSSIHWLAGRWQVLKDESGRPLRVTGINIDITGLKQAEDDLRRLNEELEERVRDRTAELHETVEVLRKEIAERERAQTALANERQRFFSVLERIPAYVVLISPDRKIPFANREFIRRFGDPGDGWCHEFLFGLTDPCEGCKALEVFKTQAPATWEWSGPDGNTYQVYDYSFTDVDGSPLVLEMGIDITALKNAQQALQKSREDLRFLASRILFAQEQERKRVAYELHDNVGQALTVMKMQLRAAQKNLPEENLVKKDYELLRTYLDNIIESIRDISYDLSPSGLEDLGLIEGLKSLFKDTCAPHNIKCSFHIDNVDKLFSLEEQLNLYRIFQEILNNVLKHASASRLELDVRKLDGSINFSIKDNGQGFDFEEVWASRTKDRGLGLTSLQERTRMMGGSLNIESRKGTGTTITINVPLSMEQEKQRRAGAGPL